MATYARPIRLTASGTAINRPCVVSGITVVGPTADTLIHLRDGGATASRIFSVEADNATASFGRTFNPPLKFFNNVYVEFESSGASSSCTIEVCEP
jgi:hypothetical protein